MDEAVFWSDRVKPKLVKFCQQSKLRHHFERVENRVADGTPDVDYLIGGVAGKLELKYSPVDAISDAAQVLGTGKGLRRSQIVFAARYGWAGGRIWCMVGTPGHTWLIDLRGMAPEAMHDIATASRTDLYALAAWSSARGWHVLPEVLTSRC